MRGLVQSLGGLINAALAFVYPETCQICGRNRATPADCFVCPACRRRIRLISPPFCARCGLPFDGEITQEFDCSNCRELEFHFRSARSAAVARGEMLEIIHRYKYKRALWFEPLLAQLLVNCARDELDQQRWDWIVPVPLHPTKQREREFNQAERLARRLAAARGIAVNTRLIERIRPTLTQTRLSREERRANVRKAFRLRKNADPGGKRVVLVDDVFTTGATTNACAEVLLAAGAEDVCVWTVARGGN